MIELYSGKETGSGQINAGELSKAFDFSGDKKADLEVVTSLCKLSSYDVYSLRIGLRKLGINVEEHEHLRLSQPMVARLSDYMSVFTKPLVAAVYGDTSKSAGNHNDMLKLFMSPDKDVAKNNLQKLSEMLEISIADIPAFLQDYGDVYLSLAYYQYCVDTYHEQMAEFFVWLDELRRDPATRSNGEFTKISQTVERTVKSTTGEVRHILGMFESRTANMWDNPSAEKFRAMKDLVIEYQCLIGGALCAVTVKLDAWSEKFRFKAPGAIHRRVEFIMSEMRYGLDQIQPIKYSDAPQ